MGPLSDLIETRSLAVACPHCTWSGYRSLSWLSERRDMTCPTCDGVIVLNTSARRREIAHERRMVSTLHDHFVKMIPVADRCSGTARTPIRKVPVVLQLELASAYGKSLDGYGNEGQVTRRFRSRSHESAAELSNAPKHRQ
jgi:PHP family Zn ribbon phosphoesterase